MGKNTKENAWPLSGLVPFARAVSALMLPDRCMVCRAYLTPDPKDEPLASCFCASCLALPLPRFASPYCPCCGRLLPKGSGDSGLGENHLCESCLRCDSQISRVRAAFAYEGIVRTAVGLLKYKRRIRLAGPLSHYLFDSFEQYFIDEAIDLVLPVPLHISRAWERQFNQAVLLVRDFPRRFQQRFKKAPAWEIRLNLLSRNRPTLSQTGLDQKAREKNLKQAFAVTAPDRVRGKRILLVDDVYTSYFSLIVF